MSTGHRSCLCAALTVILVQGLDLPRTPYQQAYPLGKVSGREGTRLAGVDITADRAGKISTGAFVLLIS